MDSIGIPPVVRKLLPAAAAAAVAALVFLAYWYLRSPESTLIKAGDLAPDLELPSASRSPTRLSNFRGRPVLLVMFLSNCHICENEIGQIERLHREFYKEGLVVLGVSVDQDAAARQAFIQRHGLTFIVLSDDNGQAVRAAYGSFKMPEAYLIRPDGRVEAVYLGSANWRGEVRERIRKLLPPREGDRARS
jgi:peroxiredoxin